MLVNIYMFVYSKGNGMPVKIYIYMFIYFKRRSEMLVNIYMFVYFKKKTEWCKRYMFIYFKKMKNEMLVNIF